MINVGLIGTGYIGGVHLDALKRIQGVNVTVVQDINREYAESTARRFNIPKFETDYKAVIRDPAVDVIHNCTPNKFHYPITKEALEAGKHVLSEKPLAMTLNEAKELVELAEKKNVVTGVDFCYRYYPLVQEMAVRMQRGDAGALRMITGTWFQDWLSKDTDYSWRLDKKESGGSNITADLGSHWFDLIQFVTGKKLKEVMGDFKTIIPVRKKPTGQVLAFEESDSSQFEEVTVDVEDYSAVLFHLDDETPGSFTTSQVCNGRKSDTEFQVYGSKSSMAWNHKYSDKLWIGHRDRPNETLTESPILQDSTTARFATLPTGHPVGYNDAVLNLFKDFYNTVETGKEENSLGRPTFKTGYDEMIVLDAVMKSANERKWVSVDW
jgi:predicted dehydrogenase